MSGTDLALCDDDLTPSDLSTILLTKGVTGGLGLIACIITIVVFCSCLTCNINFKRRLPKSGTGQIVHRLVICMAVYATFRSVAVILQAAATSEGVFCQIMGFMDQWSVWAMLLVIQMIVIHLMVQHCSRCGCKVDCCSDIKTHYKKTNNFFHSIVKAIPQIIYFTFPIMFPLVFSWIPFIRNSYGLSGGWCWIRIEDEYDCRQFVEGLIEQVAFWFIPMVVFQIWNVIFFFIVYPCLVYGLEEGKLDLCLQQAPLLTALILSIIINLCSLGNRIAIGVTSADHKILAVWIFHALASSCWGIFAALVIVVHMVIIRCRSPRETDSVLYVNSDGPSKLTSVHSTTYSE